MKKDFYTPPFTEVVEMSTRGVLLTSLAVMMGVTDPESSQLYVTEENGSWE